MLLECNPFVHKFQYAKQLLKENPSLDLSIVMVSNKEKDKRICNKPSSNEIAVLIPSLDENNEPTNKEAIVFEKNGDLKFIDTSNKFKACY